MLQGSVLGVSLLGGHRRGLASSVTLIIWITARLPYGARTRRLPG
jgi:hypothetical protein